MADLSTRVPEPALVRGLLVALVGVLAVVLGREIDVAWVDLVVQAYTLASPLLAGLLIRRAVKPVESNLPRL
ncbi:hypothetical protein [Nocardia sp. IFM 10818]